MSASRCCRCASRARIARRIVWDADDVVAPSWTGLRTVAPSVEELRPLIDWTFFFHAWELKGKFPAILDDPEKGAAARDLYEAANVLLDGAAAGLRPEGVHGFWRAAAEGDDIVLENGVRFPMLRRQADPGDSRPTPSLADFVAPAETGLIDHIGAFAVAVHGADELAACVRLRARRLPVDPGQGGCRPARRGIRRVAPRPCPARLVRAGRGSPHGRADRRALPRHPTGVRVSSLPRSLREAHAFRSCSTPAVSGSS